MSKLLLVVPTLSSYEAFLSDFSEAAMAAGHEVHVATQLTLLDGRSVEAHPSFKSGVKLHSISMPRGANPIAALKAAKELRGLVSLIQPDWIQAHFSAAALVCSLAKTRSWPFTGCIIQGLACTLAKGKARVAAWAGERLAMVRLDEMWVLTEDDFTVIKRWNSKKARLQQSPGFGCRLDRFDPSLYSAEWRNAQRTKLGISAQDTVLIYVGRLAAFKGFDRVVRAYQDLRKKEASVRLLILGAFDSFHPSGLTTEEIQVLQQDPNVVLPGWQDNVAEWLATSDLCVFPSEREGMPVCLMEALCMGVPVVTSDSRGCRDVVRNGLDGIVLASPDTEGLVNAIGSLLEHPELLEGMRRESLRQRSHFDRRCYIEEQLKNLELRVN
jgi:glycosyltransferase involved in cell wall biosynthesis